MTEQLVKYSLLGDTDGTLLPHNQVNEKAAAAVTALSQITDPDSTCAALEGMSKRDVEFLIAGYRQEIGDLNILRMFAARPLWVPQPLAKQIATSIVASRMEVPNDVEFILECQADDLLQQQRHEAEF